MQSNESPANASIPRVEDLKVDTVRPKLGCKKCHGTGRLGFVDGDKSQPLVCSCVIKVYNKVREQVRQAKANQSTNAVDIDKKTDPNPSPEGT